MTRVMIQATRCMTPVSTTGDHRLGRGHPLLPSVPGMSTPNALTQPSQTTRTTEPVPRLSLGPLGITVRVIVAIGMLFGANYAVVLVPAALSLIPATEPLLTGESPWGYALAIGLQALVLSLIVAGVWAWMRWIERAPIRAAGWHWNHRSGLWLALGIAVSASTVVAVVAALPAIGDVLDDEALLGSHAVPEGISEPVLTALLIAYFLGLAFLQQGIGEELLFRGWLLWRLRGRPILAIAVTTFGFTVIHLTSQGGQTSAWEHIAYLAIPCGFSLLAVGMLLWTGSLWAAVGVHGGFHIGNYTAMAALPQVDPVTYWVTIGAVQATLGLVLIVTALRHGRQLHG